MTTLKTLAGACALALLAAAPAPAQTPPPPYGPPIGIENARKVMTAAEAEAAKNNWAVVISIIDSGGNIVMLHRRDDVQLSSIEIAQGKAKTALMFKRPSKVLDDAIAGGGAGPALSRVEGHRSARRRPADRDGRQDRRRHRRLRRAVVAGCSDRPRRHRRIEVAAKSRLELKSSGAWITVRISLWLRRRQATPAHLRACGVARDVRRGLTRPG